MDIITKFSLICIIVGLVGLYFISLYASPNFVDLSKIDETYLNKMIQTSGIVRNIYLSNTSTLFLTIEDKGNKIKVVKFKVERIELKKGDYILVEGEVALYKNELEIIAKKIKKLGN